MKRDLAEVITKAIDYKQSQLRVCMPGTVVAYNPATQTATIQPPIAAAIDLEEGTLIETLPLLSDVPVEFPRGGGYLLMFPLNPGDTGLLEFTDFSMDLWRASGLDGAPNDLRHHALGNCLFRPGLSPSTRPVANPPTGMLVGSELGTLPVLLGSAGATDFVALASLVLGELQKVQTYMDTLHSVLGAAPPVNEPGNGAPSAFQTAIQMAFSSAVPPIVNYPTPTPVASAVVKSV